MQQNTEHRPTRWREITGVSFLALVYAVWGMLASRPQNYPPTEVELLHREAWQAILVDHQQAVDLLTKVLEVHPDNVLAHRNRGECYFALGLDDLGRRDRDRAIELDPTLAVVLKPTPHNPEDAPYGNPTQ
jgi:tetratricopeptide (TPR) repeat protein